MAKTSAAKKKEEPVVVPFAVPDWPATGVEVWKLDKIKPYPNNPRTHPDQQIKLLAELMQKYGVDQPIVVDEEGVILKGHGRLLAAKKAGFEEFPVVIQRGRTEAEKRAIRVADNQMGLLSEWNPELLRLEVGDLKLGGFSLPLLGFNNYTLGQIEHGLGAFAPDDDQIERGALLELIKVSIEDPKHTVEHGDHYTLSDRHHLICDSVIAAWPTWAPLLKEGSLFCPYPGVFVPFSGHAKKHPLVMVQPDEYIMGHILDRYVEVCGKKAIKKV